MINSGFSSGRCNRLCQVLLLAVSILLCLGRPGAQATLTVLGNSGYATTGSVKAVKSPDPVDLYDLDHHNMYAWQIEGLANGVPVTWATITFTNIYNWDTNPNRLYLWMFEIAKNPGVTSFTDDPNDNTFVNDFGTSGAAGYNKLASASKGIELAQLTFDGPNKPAVTHTYVFTASEVTKLNKYLADGKIAFGFDPDCHYFNDGITFRMGTGTLTPCPEPSAILPLLALLGVAAAVRPPRRRRTLPVSRGGEVDVK